MRPYIFGKKNLIHIIDIKETVRGMLRAEKYLREVAAANKLILFVGTKRQASEPVREAAEACGMPYVTERWLGGTLTNFRTIRGRLDRLHELEHLRETGELNTYSKKQQSRLMREYRKIYRNLNGVRDLERIPEVMVICDPTQRAQRRSRGEPAGRQNRLPDRYRQRPGPHQPADPRQRRFDPLHPAGLQLPRRGDQLRQAAPAAGGDLLRRRGRTEGRAELRLSRRFGRQARGPGRAPA